MPQFLLGAPRHLDRNVDRAAGVVGVEQEGVAPVGLGHRHERLLLSVEELDQRVGDRAGGEQAEAEGRAEEGGAGGAADEGGARDDVGILRPAQRELGDPPAPRGVADPGGLGGDQRRQVDRLQQPRLQQQRLAEGRGHAQDRLVREGDRPLGHGQDLAGEAEVAQFVEEARVVVADLREETQVLVAVAELAHELERRLDPSHQHERAVERGAAREKVEGRLPVAPGAPTDIGGVRVVEIGQQPRMITGEAPQHRVRPSLAHPRGALPIGARPPLVSILHLGYMLAGCASRGRTPPTPSPSPAMVRRGEGGGGATQGTPPPGIVGVYDSA